jgi:hypothetical protein
MRIASNASPASSKSGRHFRGNLRAYGQVDESRSFVGRSRNDRQEVRYAHETPRARPFAPPAAASTGAMLRLENAAKPRWLFG